MAVHEVALERRYHDIAAANTVMVSDVIGTTTPMFVYLNKGSHIPLVSYPVRQVMMDATNDQLLRVNTILPQAIEYLFLRVDKDLLWAANRDALLARKPILNNEYLYQKTVVIPQHGTTVVVYRRRADLGALKGNR